MTTRHHDIDWLRIIAIVLVLYFHVAMIFVEDWDWHIKNEERSYLWLEFNFFLSRFRMPLLFVISGLGSWFAFRKRNVWQYIKERGIRLIIPLLFGMLVIVPPQIYFERLFQGDTYTSFWQFYATVFECTPYPEGNLSWHHLWFVLYLFIYSAVAAPFFQWLKSHNGSHLRAQLHFFNHPIRLYFLALPSVFIHCTLAIQFPQTNALVGDYGYLLYWFTFFVVGYLIAAQPSIWKRIEKSSRRSLQFAILATLIVNYFRWNRIELDEGSWLFLFVRATTALSGWLWLFTAMGYGKRYLNRPHPILAYANRAIYPFYIIHQTIIVIIGYYVVTLVTESILAKYLFISTLSLILSIAFYDFLVRPFRVMRFLFGVKSLKKRTTLAKKIAQKPQPELVEL
ncbi:MAG: acyltransferase family protein [Bacteroidota bacterium]